MSDCAQRTGFLTLLTCGQPAVAACARCGKAICGGHSHSVPAGPCCPDCAAIGLDAHEASRRGLDSSYYRNSSLYDSDYALYSAADYASFETFQGGGGEMDGGGAQDDWGGSADGDSSGDGGAGDFQDS